MDEFVLLLPAKAAQRINHASTHAFGNPHVAIQDPDYIALGLAVCPAHVANLWVWPKFDPAGNVILEVRIIAFDQDVRVKGRKLFNHAHQRRIGWIVTRRYTKEDGQLLPWIVLVKGRGQAFEKARLESFDGSDDGNVRDFGFRQ